VSNEIKDRFEKFIEWFDEHITGDEKGEGQLFFDRLLQAFGNAGVREAGATCEERVKKRTGRTGFADLVWKPRVIIELKKRGEKLDKHYEQAFEYWLTLVPDRPNYMILCNFDEFWVYDLNQQLNDPVHKLNIKDLPENWGALGFLFPAPKRPVFDNHNIAVTEEVAKIVGSIYLSLVERGIEANKAQRFVLQLVVAMFAEDVGLMPKYTLQTLLKDAAKNPILQSELFELFTSMSTESSARKKAKYSNIGYFNGGLFTHVEPVELTFEELDLLADASSFNWQRVRPSIFGSIFEGSMDADSRHGHGIHYTSELDIQKIINPTIVKPFRDKIVSAGKNKKKLSAVLKEIEDFQVLDPACGSGNFLYLAFRELRRLEVEILGLMDKNFNPQQLRMNLISPKNFFGIDTNKFGLELAKIALSIGRKLSADEFGIADSVLPFDDLDANFLPRDALFSEWPHADVIIGNPPFQSKNKMQEEMGRIYVDKLRTAYPEISGYADYCVYWFRKAHDNLRAGGRAGLVGTNTIRQNQSRESGLDYIVGNGGHITEAVSSQVWSGDAVVHVSIVNWVKGHSSGLKKLFWQKGDSKNSPWEIYELDEIPPTLSPSFDVRSAKPLRMNKKPVRCFQGQTHGHEGFLLSPQEAADFEKKQKCIGEVVFPFLIGNELVGTITGQPKRYVIDFSKLNIQQAMKYKHLFSRIEKSVLPDREKRALDEKVKNEELLKENPKARLNKHCQVALNSWWKLRWSKLEMLAAINKMPRYIACSRVTKRQIFAFVSSKIHPNDKIQVFAFSDDYSFGIISSSLHWQWFLEKCTTLKGDFNYNARSIWDTFPWPQKPNAKQIKNVCVASRNLRHVRSTLMIAGNNSYRDIYKSLDLPGKNDLKVAIVELDKAVRSAYGFRDDNDLINLLDLNLKVYALGEKATGPGLPPSITDPESFVSEDCIQPPEDY
jgi:hypothetical protein